MINVSLQNEMKTELNFKSLISSNVNHYLFNGERVIYDIRLFGLKNGL